MICQIFLPKLLRKVSILPWNQCFSNHFTSQHMLSNLKLLHYMNSKPSKNDTFYSCSVQKRQYYGSNFIFSQARKMPKAILNETKRFMDTVKNLKYVPTPALAIGLTGLVPFLSFPLLMMSQGVFSPGLADAHVIYGAIILSFVGGFRWGFVMFPNNSYLPDWKQLGRSIMAPLIAWPCMLIPSPIDSIGLIGGFLFICFSDINFEGFPHWFKHFRVFLTYIVVFSLILGILCQVLPVGIIKCRLPKVKPDRYGPPSQESRIQNSLDLPVFYDDVIVSKEVPRLIPSKTECGNGCGDRCYY